MVGADLLHYRVEAHLGAGGMGEVYRARDTKLGRAVAIKTLPDSFALDPDRLARFEREAKLLASLNHPAIAGLHAWEHAGGRHFLVMELVEGETLADRLHRGPIPVGDALVLAKQICEALEAAHERGVIHRDLKPANIKITPGGQVKVLDFGLAKALDTATGGAAGPGGAGETGRDLTNAPTLTSPAKMTGLGVILGTAAYMSPEQAKSAATDQRSDIFALGCVLFEMLSGRQAFQGDSVTEIMASVLKNDPDFTLLPANLHPRLSDVLRRCLAKDPKRRWHAVADVRMELEAIQADPSGISARVPLSAPPRPLWRRALPSVAAAVIASVISSALVWYARTSPAAAVTRFSIVLPEDQQVTRAGRHALALSPDGQNLVYQANRQLYLRRLDEIEARPIPGTNVDAASPFFSPDGGSIGFWSGVTGRLETINIAGGTPVPIGEMAMPFGASWKSDAILAGQGRRGIVRVPASGGEPETIITVESGEWAHGPQMLPDDDHVLFTLRKDPNAITTAAVTQNGWDFASIVVQSLQSGTRTVVIEGATDARYVPTGHLVFAVGTSLYAAAFDVRSLTVTSERVPMGEAVARAGPSGTGAMQFGWSANGTAAHFVGGDLGALTRSFAFVGRNGEVTPLSLPPDSYANPRISPDGRQLVVQRANEDGSEVNLWIYDLTGTVSPRQLTLAGATVNLSPTWTRDGQRILFMSNRDGKGNAIFSQRADGSGPAEPVTTSQGEFEINSSMLSLSRDETMLLLRAGPLGGPGQIWIVPLDGKQKPEVIVGGPGNRVHAQFSHDGKWIVYESGESGRSEVYVQPYPITGAKYRITTGGGAQPAWSTGDRELFYVTPGTRRLMSVGVRTQSGFEAVEPRLVFENIYAAGSQRPYSISPDGRVLIMKAESEVVVWQPSAIRVTLNWFEELKRRVPVN